METIFFTVNEKEWILNRIKVIQSNTNCSLIAAIQAMSDIDYEDFVRCTKSNKSLNQFYNFLGC